MRRNTPVSWLLAVCFAVLVMGEAEQREEGELEDEGEDEYYGSDFWGEGQADQGVYVERSGEAANADTEPPEQDAHGEIDKPLRTDLTLDVGTYITESAGSVVVRDLNQVFVLATMRREGTISDSLKGVQVKDLNLTFQGSSMIVRFDKTGRSVKGATVVADFIFDIDAIKVGKSYRVVVATELGVICLNARANRPLWLHGMNKQPSRVKIAPDGSVVALSGNEVILISAEGKEIKRKSIKKDWVMDVAISTEHKSVYVCGFGKVSTDMGMVQVAFLYAFDLDLKMKWKNWDWPGSVVQRQYADTRALRLKIGPDGNLYVLGQATGGKNIFRWGPRDVNTLGNLFETDRFTQSFDVTDAGMAYVARLDAGTGDILIAQTILAIEDDGKGKVSQFETSWGFKAIGDVAISSSGHVYIGGVINAGLPDHALLKVDGKHVGSPKQGPDAVMLVLSPDFDQREIWTSFATEGVDRSSQVRSITVSEGVWVFNAAVHRGGMITTDGAIAKEPPFSPSSYLAVGVDEWLASTARADAAADTGARGQVAEEKPELL